MKKTIAYILIAAMLLGLCGCGKTAQLKASGALSLSVAYKDLLGDQTMTRFTDDVITLIADGNGSLLQIAGCNDIADTDFDLQAYERTEDGCRAELRYVSYSANYLSEEIYITYKRGGSIDALPETYRDADVEVEKNQKAYFFDDGTVRYGKNIIGLGIIEQFDGYTLDVMYRQFQSDGSETTYYDASEDDVTTGIFSALVKLVKDEHVVLVKDASKEDNAKYLPQKLVMAMGENEKGSAGMTFALKSLDKAGWNEDSTEMFTEVTALDEDGGEIRLSFRNGAAVRKYAEDGAAAYGEWDKAYLSGEADLDLGAFLGTKAVCYGDGYLADLGTFSYDGKDYPLYYYVEILSGTVPPMVVK